MTDLKGRDLDFSNGRLMDKKVRGIIASNGAIHDELLKLIDDICHADDDDDNDSTSRTYMD